ncbi:TPA: restriction endonuclease subunit S [Streptococcus equi subsp. zooepidemicus]|nr:restriction endonuclease subunit S [Streptococcus equi subsp. zooepidemicus]
MAVVKFGDVVREVKSKIDRNNNPYEYYIAGDHMDSEDLHLHRKGSFATDDVGPAFIREFLPGQILYGSRRTYLKKVAVADFSGVTANTTFVLETKNEEVLRQKLIPFIMLSDAFTEWSISKSKGSTNPYVLFSDLAGFEFELPSIEEQDKLVDLLWSMDDAIVSYKEAIAKTDELVKSQFIEMFYDKGYPVKSIGDVVDRKIARVAKVFSKTDEIQYLDISSIDNASKTVTGLTTYTLVDAPSRAQYVLAKDDIVYSTVRPNLQNIAKNPYEEENVVGSTGFCVLRCTGVSTGYMWGVVNSTLFTDTMINKASGANYPAVTDKVVLAYEIPIPPEDQQLAYEHLVRQSDKSKFALKDTMKSVEAMMNKIVTNSFKVDREEG